MNNWIRRPELDDSFNDMHGIRPQVSYLRENRNRYNIKLVSGGKEVVITEVMDKGLTSYVSLRSGDETKCFNSVYDAEVYATHILRS